MQFVPGYREQNAPRRTPAAGSPVDASSIETKNTIVKEDENCNNSSMTKDLQGNDTMRPLSGMERTGDPTDSMNPTGGMADSSTGSLQADLGGNAMNATAMGDSGITSPSTLDQSNAALMGDAPACDVCGSITIRNGTCYKCLNCGNSMGCS
jgi:ribonucleoside-diphosphate reductase alpha chain